MTRDIDGWATPVFPASVSLEQTSRQVLAGFYKLGWSEKGLLWLGGEPQQTSPKSEYAVLPYSLSSPEKPWPHSCELTRIFFKLKR